MEEPKHIGDLLKERTIILETQDPVLLGGFTQVPNFILENEKLSFGAKVVYALFLRYSWHEAGCFPGQDRLAKHMGCGRSTATRFVQELKTAGYLEIERRGQGKTNIYHLKFNVQRARKKKR